MKKDEILLSKKQYQAVTEIVNWYHSDEKYYVLAGYAGSGKSTLAARLQEKIGGVFCTYTAKAADVLNKKGVNACTIHSLVYNYEGQDPVTKKMLWSLKQVEYGKGLLIVDEYSMVSKSMLDDLKSKFKKILFMGDPAQLPPIEDGRQTLVPNFFLDEVHRQAADNPILKWAHNIRNGKIPYGDINEDGMFIVKSANDLTDEEMAAADQIIVGKNKTVFDINNYMRGLYGHSDLSNLPVRGEKLICLQNNHDKGLFNGRVFECESNAKKWDIEREAYSLKIGDESFYIWDGDILGKPKEKYSYYSKLERVNYAYAMTCHKTQGSEYDSIIVINESWGATKLNWLYTAVTRGKKKVILAHP